MKFYFQDEPQFATAPTRAWAANYLRACRVNPGNPTVKRYNVRRLAPNHYTIELRYSGSPIAHLITR